jgi:aminopeptidase N
MSSDAPQPVLLKDYEPPSYRTLDTRLSFDIRDGYTRVESQLSVERRPGSTDRALRLDGQNLELISVALDGRLLGGNEFVVDAESLTLFDLPERCEIAIVTRIEPEKNTALEGLYKSGSMYCTQCEAEGFRRITYYQDRPDVLSRFTTTLEADASLYPVLLANGNPISDIPAGEGRRRVTWEDPFPKPSYLFALVAGDLSVLEDEFVTASGRPVALRIFSEPHNIGQCGYAMGALKRAMRWDEETFGREYDLDILMIVAVEDFNMGAMENKGLNIFNTKCVLASPDTATDAAHLRVESVVAHEYFHNWSGNRVTCRDWFQLSLKEGFTVFRDEEFSSDMNFRAVKRIEDVNFLRSSQFPEDAGPMAHPVRPDSYIEISNFYTTTVYEKGSEVVRMLRTLLGEKRFRRGSDLFFDRYDGCAATTDDFLGAMADVTALDLNQFRRWYEQAGTPRLQVEEAWRDGRLNLRIRQSCPPTPGQGSKKPFHLPVLIGLLDGAGRDLVDGGLDCSSDAQIDVREGDRSLLVHVRDEIIEIGVSGLPERPAVSFLRGFSAPVRVDYPRDSETLAFLALHDSDGFARWDALQTLVVREIDAMRLGGEPAAELVALLGKFMDPALGGGASAEQRFLLSELLNVADEGYLFQALDDFEVEAVCDARDRLVASVAANHAERWRALYEANAASGPYAPEPDGMSRRALRNTALGYLARVETGSALESLLEDHYRSADNLTDRSAALRAVADVDGLGDSFRREILGEFHRRWRAHALVVDLWFSVQASSPRSSAGTIRELESHPDFDGLNPNKLRALYGAFGQMNHRNFHAQDGSGYEFLADRVLELDRNNPQIAARLLTPLTRWRRYDNRRQTLMTAALRRVEDQQGLSKDVFEVVTKTLATED